MYGNNAGARSGGTRDEGEQAPDVGYIILLLPPHVSSFQAVFLFTRNTTTAYVQTGENTRTTAEFARKAFSLVLRTGPATRRRSRNASAD